MLTRLQVRGFKNLHHVDVRFGPFTCIAGLNGAGKSNLFDAIRFLSLLTRHPIMEAARLLRETTGRSPEPRSLFTAFGDYVEPEIRFVADMIVERGVQDDFGVPSTAAISTLRYEVAFRLGTGDNDGRLELAYESLDPIKLRDAAREFAFPVKKQFRESVVKGRRVGDFISTSPSDGGPEITVHQEGHGGRKLPAPRSSRTVIGGMANSDFPTILAAHREMASWQTLLLEPSGMRAPSLYQDSKTIDTRGGNLPAAIHRLTRAEARPGMTCAELVNQLSNLIGDVEDLHIRDDPKTETLTLEVRGRSGIFHPARSLSDGTLRFLVLATMSIDPQVRGMICLEEPENGIHPTRIAHIIKLLKDIAVDTDYAIGKDNPLRQVVVNTHSPAVVNNISADDLLYVDEQTVKLAGSTGVVAQFLPPPRSWRARFSEHPVAQSRIADYVGRPLRDGSQYLLDLYTGASQQS